MPSRAAKPPANAAARTHDAIYADIYAAIYEAIYAASYAAVIDLRLAPGSRLREEELAQAVSVSRTLVRQALHKLAQDGVITLRPNRGAVVPEPMQRDGEPVFDARRVVECEVARRLAGKPSGDQQAALQRTVNAEALASESQNKEVAIRLSGEFHRQLAQMSGNPIVVRLLEELLPATSLLMARYKAPGEPMCIAHSHRQLLAAWMATPAATATEMRRHLNEIERSLSKPFEPKAVPLRDVFKACKAAAP